MPEFKNKICYENIISLYKAKGFKIGEFETEIGASIGYFSRLVKDDGKIGAISSEILFKAANVLDVPVDELGSVDLTCLDSTNQYYFNFLNRVLDETKNNNLNWKQFRKENLLYEKKVADLMKIEYNPYDGEQYQFYNSKFWDDRKYKVNLSNDVFGFDSDNGIFILTCIDVTSEDDFKFKGYELYFKDFESEKNSKICYSAPDQNQCINQVLESLFKAVVSYIKKPKIEDNVRVAIDSFMKAK